MRDLARHHDGDAGGDGLDHRVVEGLVDVAEAVGGNHHALGPVRHRVAELAPVVTGRAPAKPPPRKREAAAEGAAAAAAEGGGGGGGAASGGGTAAGARKKARKGAGAEESRVVPCG